MNESHTVFTLTYSQTNSLFPYSFLHPSPTALFTQSREFVSLTLQVRRDENPFFLAFCLANERKILVPEAKWAKSVSCRVLNTLKWTSERRERERRGSHWESWAPWFLIPYTWTIRHTIPYSQHIYTHTRHPLKIGLKRTKRIRMCKRKKEFEKRENPSFLLSLHPTKPLLSHHVSFPSCITLCTQLSWSVT